MLQVFTMSDRTFSSLLSTDTLSNRSVQLMSAPQVPVSLESYVSDKAFCTMDDPVLKKMYYNASGLRHNSYSFTIRNISVLSLLSMIGCLLSDKLV